jgi:hypothetical protein
MSLGLSWISLDSLVRIETFQWVTRLEAGKLFLACSSALRGAGTGARGRGHAEAQDWSWPELNLTSDFLQWIVVRSITFRASIQNQLALVRRLRVLLNDNRN